MGKDDRNSGAPTQVAAVPRVFSIHCTVFLKNKICIIKKKLSIWNVIGMGALHEFKEDIHYHYVKFFRIYPQLWT